MLFSVVVLRISGCKGYIELDWSGSGRVGEIRMIVSNVLDVGVL